MIEMRIPFLDEVIQFVPESRDDRLLSFNIIKGRSRRCSYSFKGWIWEDHL